LFFYLLPSINQSYEYKATPKRRIETIQVETNLKIDTIENKNEKFNTAGNMKDFTLNRSNSEFILAITTTVN
jgi:hypothetical protein